MQVSFSKVKHVLGQPASFSPCLLKTLGKKEKMLVTSVFSFSNNVFYPTREREIIISATVILSSVDVFNLGQLFGIELTLYHSIPTFNDPV